MRPASRLSILTLVALAGAVPALPQSRWKGFEHRWDALARYEWNEPLSFTPTPDRWMLRYRPAVEFGGERLHVGVGGNFIYSEDENYDPKPVVQRDNYKSRDARFDLAYLQLKPASWLTLEGGRFAMPIPVTEMIWDHDLRPQGAAATVSAHDGQGRPVFRGIGLWARGSHVFEDEETDVAAGSATLTLYPGQMTSTELTGAFFRFTGLDSLEPMLRRQNRRVGGRLVNKYDVVDLVARFQHEGTVFTQLVAEYCWNTKVDVDNKGVWLAAIFGSTRQSRMRLEYSYAYVERDATLGAYAADDFLWTTAWEHHKGDLGVRVRSNASLHAVGQVQRFLSAATPEEREKWYSRWRVELRLGN